MPTRKASASSDQFAFYEFFAGGGMASLGLGRRWKCMFANEWCEKKAAAYHNNFRPAHHLVVKDIAELKSASLPGHADLAWASFPCQDLSLAGMGRGLDGERSGTFWSFWRLMKSLKKEGRSPRIIALENVVGTLSSNQGQDFEAICGALSSLGYRFGAMVVDAVHFVPQSRPRLFIVATSNEIAVPSDLQDAEPSLLWHNSALRAAYFRLPAALMEKWVWWRLPAPKRRETTLRDIIEKTPAGVSWHTPEETRRLTALMSAANLAKLRAAQTIGARLIGCVYKRTRRDEAGGKTQRAEIRFDDVSGCLRTPTGGSSRQTVVLVKGEKIRSRLLSPREAARLMGLPDDYKLPGNYNEAYHLAGDGVAVPVVWWLEKHILHRLVRANSGREVYEAA
ncbi:MAG: DNA cytosine methyltransferase [Rhodospirillales bacterium]|nr:DNA cytosine methyltransferase [Rhodospirillales bacterium]